MRRAGLSVLGFWLLAAAASAHTHHHGHGHVRHSAPGQLSHAGVIAPMAPNDRNVIPANPAHDPGMVNPGHSQDMINHTAPSAE